MSHGTWQPVEVPPRTIFDILNRNIIELQRNNPDSLPNLRAGRVMLLGSDYSGESFDAPYLVYSFLLTTIEAWAKWEPMRLEIRQKLLSDGRRMSFKRLGDFQRNQALLPLLKAANHLEGLSFSIAINKRCESLFEGESPLDLGNQDFESYRKWKKGILEKAFVIINFLTFLIAGLSKPGQDVLWFTDEDSIAANDQRVCELTNLFAWISSQYIKFSLGHCRCGTSRCDDGTRQIEDFLAIPDLIAGSLSEQMKLQSTGFPILPGVFWMHRGDFSEKARVITWWLSSPKYPLKRLFCMLDPDISGHGHKLSWYHFHDRMD
jgi:hypothetical protein